MIHLSEKDFRAEIDRAYRKGWDNAFVKSCDLAVMYMLSIPLLVLHDHFNEIRMKEYEGVSRVEHFFDLCAETFEEYNQHENTLSRVLADVERKTGFDVSKRVFSDDEKGGDKK